MKLYQFDLAPSSNRVALFLKETGINVPIVQLNVRDGDQFKEPYNSMNPFHCVPFLELGNGIVISESLAICKYLQNTFSSNNLFIPQTAQELAEEDEWCSFIYGELDETCLYVMRRHYDLTDIYGSAPHVVDACREYLKRQFLVIDEYLENKKSLLDQGFGVADIFLVSCLDWAVFYEFEMPKNIKIYKER